MNDLQLRIQSPPFQRSTVSTQRLMLMVLLALCPAVVAAYYYFGTAAIIHIVATMAAAVLAEVALQWILHRPITILDGSAAVTGLLLALNLPPQAPYWLGPAGAIIAISVVKQVFGGLGHNFVNPALAARALMMASWPAQMVAFVKPFDSISSATPLAIIANSEMAQLRPTLWQLFSGEVAGTLGETCSIALILGGLLLIYSCVIDYRIPSGILLTVLLLGSCFAGPDFSFSFSLPFGIYQLLSGGIMLGAFFMATDYVTSPVTPRGRWLYGIGIGFIIILIRFWGRYPEGVTFAILLMNIASPLIERATIPHKFGEVSRSAQK